MVVYAKWTPEKILVDFLRTKLDEPVRVDYSNRQVHASHTFSGDNNQKIFTLVNTPMAIRQVVVDGGLQSKYVDYEYDLRNQTITFKTAPPTGTDNINVLYWMTNTWIYPDLPRLDLSTSSYPRIAVFSIDESNESLGLFDNDMWDTWTVQINIYTKKDLKITYQTKTYIDMDVCDLINLQVQEAIRTLWRSSFGCTMYYPVKISAGILPYDEDKGIFTRTIRYQFKAMNLGEYQGV